MKRYGPYDYWRERYMKLLVRYRNLKKKHLDEGARGR